MAETSRGPATAERDGTTVPALIILGAVLLRLPLLALPLTYASDVWRQADTASIARFFLRDGFHLLYPQIYWGGSGPGYVETEFQLYPFVVSLLYAAFGERVWLGRLVSLLFTLPTLVACYLLIRRLAGPRAARLGLAFLALAPLAIRYSVAFMPEATVLCFFAVALDRWQRWSEDGAPRLALAASLATALAALVKPTSLLIGFVVAVLTLRRYGAAALRRGDVWLWGAVCLVPAALWYWHAHQIYLLHGNTFGILSGGDSKFGGLADRLRPGLYYRLARLDLTWVFAWGAAVPFAAGLLHALRARRLLLLPLGTAAVFAYYTIVSRYAQERWGIQYHVFALPFAALGVGVGLDRLLAAPRRTLGRTVATGSIAAFVAGAAVVYVDMLHPPPNPLVDCGRVAGTLVARDELIAVSTTASAIEEGVVNNYEEPVVFFYADRRGWSLPADRHSAAELERLRRAGARYFVIADAAPLHQNPALEAHLRATAVQVGPGVDAGCGVYRLDAGPQPGDAPPAAQIR